MIVLLNLDHFTAPSIREIQIWLKQSSKSRRHCRWVIRNEIRPSDLYTYLHAKFGQPNGIQNILRNDDSDNLIHWDWTLQHTRGLLTFLGMNLRTEVHFDGRWDIEKLNREQLINFIRNDFAKYGTEMSRIRREELEDWETLLNPYYHLRSSIDRLHHQLQELELDLGNDHFTDPTSPSDFNELKAILDNFSEKYTTAYGLVTSLQALAPVLAETFLNLLLFLLLTPDIKDNKRLKEVTIRSAIDVKVQSLHINCIGFAQKVDWTAPECRAYNDIINNRNDMLHGNIIVNKLKTGEIFFNGKVPVFKKYEDLWEKLFTTSLQACGFYNLEDSLQAVDAFISYVLTCLKPEVRCELEYLMDRKEIGLNKRTGMVGVLLPDHITDMQPVLLVQT